MASHRNDVLRTQTAALAKVLAEKEAALLSLPGVTGCGVGFSSEPGENRVVIQVFVGAASMVPRIQMEAEQLLGKEHAVEAVAMPVPEGD
jgi:hypothetical protein